MTLRVGFLHDRVPYVGGAERTMSEFAALAPDGVQIVWCDPGAVPADLDRYVAGNIRSFDVDEIPSGTIRYHHDLTPHPVDPLCRNVFCSSAQREHMYGLLDNSPCIPPQINLRRFRETGHGERGNVCIGRMAYGKGVERLMEYPEPIDVYSSVPLATAGNLTYKGEAQDVAAVLSRYRTFVFLPTAFEPFGRAVIEAWAAGLELVLNRNIGARRWIEDDPAALDNGAEDFWQLVLSEKKEKATA